MKGLAKRVIRSGFILNHLVSYLNTHLLTTSYPSDEESQNHRMVRIGSNLKNNLLPTTLPRTGMPPRIYSGALKIYFLDASKSLRVSGHEIQQFLAISFHTWLYIFMYSFVSVYPKLQIYYPSSVLRKLSC